MKNRSDQMMTLVEKGRTSVESQGVGMKRNVEVTQQVSDTIDMLARQAAGISTLLAPFPKLPSKRTCFP